MFGSDLLVAFEISASLTHEPDGSVLCIFSPAGEEKIVISESCHALFTVYLAGAQKVEHFLRADGDACEYGRLDCRVAARFGAAQVHDQVEKILRMIRLKRKDELVVI